MLENLIKKYALAQGLDAGLADEVKEAREDGGIYALAFGNAMCTLSEERGDGGEPEVLALCHLRAYEPDDDGRQLAADAISLAASWLFAVPVYDDGGRSLGLAAKLKLGGIPDAAFIEWMNMLEWLCRNGSIPEEQKTELPEAGAPPAGNGTARALFEAAGAPLDGGEDTDFWRLALPQGVVFVENDRRTGGVRLRSLVSGGMPDAAHLRLLLAFNLGLAGKCWLICQNGLVWLCTPVCYTASPGATGSVDVAKIIQIHLENRRDIAACFTNANEDSKTADDDALRHLMHAIRA